MEQNKKATSVICTIKKQDKILGNIQNKTFIIPPYQRLYAWKDEQIKALLDDFKNCIEHNNKQEDESNKKSHFIGNVVVAKKEEKNELIDGQQRLTTIWLVLRYLLRKGFDAKDYFDIEMPIRKEDTKAIKDYCEGKTLDECFNDTNNTNVGFKNAFKTFEAYFGKDGKNGEGFIDFIKEKVKFNLVILGDQVELNKYFVRMNNTGVQLDGTDILKARLLKLISDNNKSEVTTYARIFDKCSQMNYFAFCYENENQNNSAISDSLKIEEIIAKHKIAKKEDKKKERAEFERIIDFPTFVLHVFKILSKTSEEIFKEGTQISIKKDKFLENTWDCLGFDNKSNEEKAEQAKTIIKALKDYRIIFDTFVIKRKSDDDKNVYKLWNKNNNWNEVSEANDLAIIQNYLRVARRGDNTNYHHFLTHYLEFCKNEIIKERKKITNENCLEILKSNAGKLKNYLKSIDDFLALKQFEMANSEKRQDLISIISEVPFNDTSFSEQPKDILESIKNLNFKNTEKSNSNPENTEKDKDKPNFDFLNQGTNTLHYWFYRLEYYLLINKDEDNNEYSNYQKNYRFRYVNSIEHIHAQKIAYGDGFKDEILHSFGNLALISSSENSSLSNNSFIAKKDWFKNNDIMSLKLFKVFENDNWVEENVIAHQVAMLKVLQKSFENT